MPSPITRQEIEQKMDELAREYRETHDPEIPEEIYRLARQLIELDHGCPRFDILSSIHFFAAPRPAFMASS